MAVKWDVPPCCKEWLAKLDKSKPFKKPPFCICLSLLGNMADTPEMVSCLAGKVAEEGRKQSVLRLSCLWRSHHVTQLHPLEGNAIGTYTPTPAWSVFDLGSLINKDPWGIHSYTFSHITDNRSERCNKPKNEIAIATVSRAMTGCDAASV